MWFSGFDPGKTGGWATLDQSFELINYGKFDYTDDGLLMLPNRFSYAAVDVETHIFVEKVHAMPKQGVVSMFTFGYVFGQLVGGLTERNHYIHFIRPQQWRKLVIPGSKGKQPAIDYVQDHYGIKVSSGIADAICIATAGIMLYNKS